MSLFSYGINSGRIWIQITEMLRYKYDPNSKLSDGYDSGIFYKYMSNLDLNLSNKFLNCWNLDTAFFVSDHRINCCR